MSDEDYDYEEATPEEKLKIASHFILRSPNGELHDVIRDLKKLIADPSVLSAENVTSILAQYNTDNFWFSKHPQSEEQLVVAAVAQQENGMFRNPDNNEILAFNHNSQKFTDVSETVTDNLDGPFADNRNAISGAIKKYAKSMFAKGKFATAVFGNESGKITIIITAKNLNLSNFWSGGWRSVYTLNVSSTGVTSLDGSIRLNSHYFEDGNVQLNTKFNKSADVTIHQDPGQTGKAIASAVDKIESDFQKKLEEFYINMRDLTFKSMRRFLPVTRKPMDWNAEAHRLAQEVRKN